CAKKWTGSGQRERFRAIREGRLESAVKTNSTDGTIPETAKPIRQQIIEILQRKPALKASEIADALGRQRREINRCLSYELAGLVQQGSDYRCRLAQRSTAATTATPAPSTEIARLSRYYLECISQDMD